MSEKLGTRNVLQNSLSISHSLTLDMLNNFFFMSMIKSRSLTFKLSHSHTLTLSHSLNLSISHSLTLDMLNNFCFHVYAQKSVFIGQNVNVFIF